MMNNVADAILKAVREFLDHQAGCTVGFRRECVVCDLLIEHMWEAKEAALKEGK